MLNCTSKLFLSHIPIVLCFFHFIIFTYIWLAFFCLIRNVFFYLFSTFTLPGNWIAKILCLTWWKMKRRKGISIWVTRSFWYSFANFIRGDDGKENVINKIDWLNENCALSTWCEKWLKMLFELNKKIFEFLLWMLNCRSENTENSPFTPKRCRNF